jgi:lipopolysaccharide export system protein LptA
MKKTYWLLIFLSLMISACSTHQKKILIYSNSDLQMDDSHKNITVTEGNTQIEKELIFNGSDPVELNVKGPQGSYKLEAAEDGYYLANLKADTVVGSMQHTGHTQQTRITQATLKIQLDSLNKLVRGENITADGKNYFVPPGKIVKISPFTSIKVFGPFTTIPSDFDAGSVTEIYKFYNLSEVNKIIGKLTEMSKYKYEKGEEEPGPESDTVVTIHPTKK